MRADVAGDALAGDPADARADLLDRHHQREAEQHHPAHRVAELRAGLRISGDAARIVVGGAGDQSRAEPAEQSLVRSAAGGAAPGDAGRQYRNCVGAGLCFRHLVGAAFSWIRGRMLPPAAPCEKPPPTSEAAVVSRVLNVLVASTDRKVGCRSLGNRWADITPCRLMVCVSWTANPQCC